MSVVLGPCPCSDCGRPLVWDGWEWKNYYGAQLGNDHDCLARARAKWDNDPAVVAQSNSISPDARLSATTREAGVTASIEVVAR